jgi:pimeloyl-ACP methyl ester carboxylesterase
MPIVGTDRARIYYEVHGEGPPLALMSGVGGNRLIWYKQVHRLAQEFRVINIDPRNCGRSSCEPDAFDLSLLGDDLLAVLDAEDVERAAIVTHAAAGYGGMRLAVDHPERVSCLVLCSSTGGLMTERLLRSLSEVSSEFSRQGAKAEQALSPEFVSRDPAAAFLVLQIYGLNEPLDPGFLANWVEAQLRSEELAGFFTPTLLVAGRHDQLVPPEVVREAASVIPGAKFLEFEESGHLPYFEQPEEFNRAVAEFVGQHCAF